MEELVNSLKANFKARYNYLTELEVDSIYRKALMIYLKLVFPFDHDIIAVPANRPRDLEWISACMVEILERSGASSVVAYSENGLKIEYDSSMISNSLRQLLIPTPGVPR